MRTYVLAATIILLALFLILLVCRRRASEGFTANTTNTTNTTYEIPHITWSYWEGDPMPELVKFAHERRQNKLADWEVHMLSPETVGKYIDMSTTPSNYNTLSRQHKADWIRLALLKKHGGAWLDSTIIINDSNALNKLASESEAARSEFTGFTTFCEKNDTSYIENWFIMAPKGSEFISKLYDEYTHAINAGFDKYKELLAKETDIKIHPGIYKFGTYLTQHTCIQAVAQKRLGRKPQMLLNRAEENMYKLQTDCNWNPICIGTRLNNSDTYKIPYLKLSSGGIKFDMPRYFKEGFVSSIGKRVDWAA